MADVFGEVAKAIVERAATPGGIVTRNSVAEKLKEEGVFRRLLQAELPPTVTDQEVEGYEDQILDVWRRGGEAEELRRLLLAIRMKYGLIPGPPTPSRTQ